MIFKFYENEFENYNICNYSHNPNNFYLLANNNIKNSREEEEDKINSPNNINDSKTKEDNSEVENIVNAKSPKLNDDICYINCGKESNYCEEMYGNENIEYSTSITEVESCYAHGQDYCERIGLDILDRIIDKTYCCWNCTA